MAKGSKISIPLVKGGSKSGEKPTVNAEGKLTSKNDVGKITGKK